ncbi:MAG: putative endonuclease [Halanaerobiales bacterium]|nr:putative endonuclease [Halanaerobiales bacterium]
MMYYVYVLKNEEGKMYIGYTSNLRKRVVNHNQGKTKSTKGHQWELIYEGQNLSPSKRRP